MSERQVPKAAGVDHTIVAAVRAAVEATGKFPSLKETIGADRRRTKITNGRNRENWRDYGATGSTRVLSLADGRAAGGSVRLAEVLHNRWRNICSRVLSG